MKYNHYVALLQNENKIKYVTKIDNADKRAFWKEGQPALKMSKSAAENLVFGLTANGFHAVIMRAPDYLELSND